MSSPSIENKCIDLLFAKFAAFYGHVWRSQFKSERFMEFAKREWAAGLETFDKKVIQAAINQCRDFYELPPTLGQVIHCCRSIKKRTTFYKSQRQLCTVDPDVVKGHLAQCKTILSS